MKIGFSNALVLAAIVLGAQSAFAQHKKDKSVHHAAVHAEHWLDHHTSAPHRRVVRKTHVRYHKKDKSVHHAAIHAEHWVDHHVSAPHKHQPNR